MKQLLFLSFVMLCFSMVSQNITGIVTDDNGNAIPFANIIEKGTNNGTTTDTDGKFTINVRKIPTTLIFSSLGFTKKEQEIVTESSITITLAEDGVGLDEIVILGNRAKERTILDACTYRHRKC